jgi:hypothetical protein
MPDRRKFSREKCEINIIYFCNQKEHKAKIYNISRGGVYLESGYYLKPGSDILIKVADNSLETYKIGVIDGGYRGEVVWSKEVSKNKSDPIYGAGISFAIVCDKCEETFSHSEIRKTDSFLLLCSECFEQMKSLSDGGKIKKSLEKHLIGNVC